MRDTLGCGMPSRLAMADWLSPDRFFASIIALCKAKCSCLFMAHIISQVIWQGQGVGLRLSLESRNVDGVENHRQKSREYGFQGSAPMPCRMPAMPVAATSLQILPSASNE